MTFRKLLTWKFNQLTVTLRALDLNCKEPRKKVYLYTLHFQLMKFNAMHFQFTACRCLI